MSMDANEVNRSADEFVAAVRAYLHDKGLA